MGNAQAIAAFMRGVRDANIDEIPNLESVIGRIVETRTAYEKEKKLAALIDVLFDERDAIINEIMTQAVPKIVEEVRFTLQIEKEAEKNMAQLMARRAAAADASLSSAPVPEMPRTSAPVSSSYAPESNDSFSDLFAPLK